MNWLKKKKCNFYFFFVYIRYSVSLTYGISRSLSSPKPNRAHSRKAQLSMISMVCVFDKNKTNWDFMRGTNPSPTLPSEYFLKYSVLNTDWLSTYYIIIWFCHRSMLSNLSNVWTHSKQWLAALIEPYLWTFSLLLSFKPTLFSSPILTSFQGCPSN